MSSQLRVSRTLLALAVGIGLSSGAALAQDQAAAKVQLPQQIQTGAEDAAAEAAAAPAVAARSAARTAAPTREQLEKQLLEMTSESSEGLTIEKRADGTEAVNLEGRFMSVMIATPAANGGYVLECQTGDGAVAHAKHAHDVEIGKAPKLLLRPTKQQPALEEK
jgi:hypothetical protein